VPTPRRPGPGGKPRRPRVAGTRKRTTSVGYGVSESDSAAVAEAPNQGQAVVEEPIHRADNGTAPLTKPVDLVTENTQLESADDSDPTGEAENSDGVPVGEGETVIARPVIDDTDDVADPDAVVEPGELPPSTAAESADVDEALPAEPVQSEAQSRPKRPIVTAVLLVLTVVCGILSFWFFTEANALRNEGPAANHALTDPAATSEVNGQISAAVQQTFSYDFANTAKTEDAAKNLLVGPAIQQYNQLYAIVKNVAPQQKLVLTTTVQASAVTMLQGDRAQLLLVVSQNDTRTDTGQNNSFTGQLSIGAVKQGNAWKIEQITQR
jgi:Mce-associated membrane protein